MSTHTIRYVTCDVFTRQRFGGNPLAVVPDARGLSDARMQQIAAEFGYSETTFVLPPEASGDRRVRIFTPKAEMPFAGHPTLGTAFVLDALGELGAPGTTSTVTFEEEAGLVPIRLSRDDAGRPWLELAAPGPLEVGRALPPAEGAGALGLSPDEVRDDTHPPCAASVGLPFWMVELRSRDALARARVDPARLEALGGPGDPTCLHVYLRSGDEADLRARMFAPLDGVAEDPATGSANAALAGLLARCEPAADGDFAWSIAQGVEMGRPSRLRARAGKRDGEVVGTWVGGSCVRVCTGVMEVGCSGAGCAEWDLRSGASGIRDTVPRPERPPRRRPVSAPPSSAPSPAPPSGRDPGKPPPRWLLKAVTRAHVFLHRISGGRLFNQLGGDEVCFVTMRGARSGGLLTIPLMYVPYGGGVLLVASQGGAPKNPAWYHNLVKHPEIEVRHRTRTLRLRARPASADEKPDLWPICDEHYAPYADYRRRTDRDIPIFVCEPVA